MAVLSDGEHEALLEGNPTRRNMARNLIDMVRGKSDDASWKMMDYLKKHDPEFFKKLGLPTQSFKGAAGVQNSRTWKKNDEKIYPVTPESMKSRVALLITNITFRGDLTNLKGGVRDEQNMERLLQTFGYEVVKYRDCTAKQIDKAVRDFSKHPKLKDTDSVFVVMMSHGKRGHVGGVNWSYRQLVKGATEEEDVFLIDNIFKHLASDKGKALENKPKIVIIQACRGGENGTVFIRDGAQKDLVCDNASASDDNGLRYMHKEKDFIAFLSCTPDTVSYTNPETGSVFFGHLVDVLNNHAREEHIEELFKMVTQRFEESDLKYGQMPNRDRVSLTKNFYLFPGN
ncbi:caspase a-like isoform X2 [Entelurus aequoreus]|uniref:caspase a-like isoform X2 n=1 Tax=Entelurus aequoreus TaxID=161455 RepID=UPI002B1D7EAA|nr:caspase a-like isoform X2 [Entelurus aequoreus]